MILALSGCEEVGQLPPSPTLADQRKPKPPVELNTRGTPGRIHVESPKPPAVTPSGPVVAVPKEVTLTARFLKDEVKFEDGSDSGSGNLEFTGTAVELDVQPYFDVSGSLYQGSFTVVEPDLSSCGFDYSQNIDISVQDDKITWYWTGYPYSDDCGEWGEKVLDGGLRIEASYYSVNGGSIEKLFIELMP